LTIHGPWSHEVALRHLLSHARTRRRRRPSALVLLTGLPQVRRAPDQDPDPRPPPPHPCRSKLADARVAAATSYGGAEATAELTVKAWEDELANAEDRLRQLLAGAEDEEVGVA